MLQRRHGSFIAGFVAAALLFGGISVGAEALERSIQVSYHPLNYVFDGQTKAPPADQQGFVYDNRTFVSLRFMSEALNKKVTWDGDTRTIYVGRKPSPPPPIWEKPQVTGEASFKLEYYQEGALNLRGLEMPNSLLVSSLIAHETALKELSSAVVANWTMPAGAKTITGTLFVPDHYFGVADERQVGYLLLINEKNQPIYRSEVITNLHEPLPFKASVDQVKSVTVHVVLFHNQGVQKDPEVYMTQLGISDLKVN